MIPFCCEHCSSDSQCFLVGRKNPPKLPLPVVTTVTVGKTYPKYRNLIQFILYEIHKPTGSIVYWRRATEDSMRKTQIQLIALTESCIQTTHEESVGEVECSYDGARHIVSGPRLHLSLHRSRQINVISYSGPWLSDWRRAVPSDHGACPTRRCATNSRIHNNAVTTHLCLNGLFPHPFVTGENPVID